MKVTMKISLVGLVIIIILSGCGGGGSGSATSGTALNSSPAASSGNSNTSTSPTNSNSSISSLSVPARYNWIAGNNVLATGAITTNAPSMATLTNGNLVAIFSQQEITGTHVYTTLGNYISGNWSTPIALQGSSGTIQGINDSTGWNQPTTSTVVAGNSVNGNALAAWTTQISNSLGYQVWISSYNASSQVWSNAVQVGTAVQAGLRATSSAAGGVAIAWVQASTMQSGLQALGIYQVSSSGTVSNTTLELGVSSTTGLKMGLDNADMMFVAWAGSNQNVYLARSGTPSWTTPVTLGMGTPADNADIDLSVVADGSGAVVWSGLDVSVHTAIFDSSGTVQSNQTIVEGTTANTRPTVASLGSGKYIVAFSASSIPGPSSSVLYYTPYSTEFNPSSGWTSPIMIGSGEGGFSTVKSDQFGDALVVLNGYNREGYFLAPGSSSSWTGGIISYNASVPAFAMDASTGHAAVLWANGNSLQSYFFR